MVSSDTRYTGSDVPVATTLAKPEDVIVVVSVGFLHMLTVKMSTTFERDFNGYIEVRARGSRIRAV